MTRQERRKVRELEIDMLHGKCAVCKRWLLPSGRCTKCDEKEFRKALREGRKPITQHTCGITCKTVPGVHKRAEIWDDFELCQKDRELVDMDVIRSRGRSNLEMTLLRQYQSTVDGSFVLRLSTTTGLLPHRIGDLPFETRDECGAYYNYCIKAFGFTEVSPVGEEIDSYGFFTELDEADTWDIDEDSEDWDIEDESFDNW